MTGRFQLGSCDRLIPSDRLPAPAFHWRSWNPKALPFKPDRNRVDAQTSRHLYVGHTAQQATLGSGPSPPAGFPGRRWNAEPSALTRHDLRWNAETARCLGIAHGNIEGNLSLGASNAPDGGIATVRTDEYSPGDFGVIIVNCNDWTYEHHGGYGFNGKVIKLR